MGLIERLLRATRPSSARSAIVLHAGGTVAIVGESYRQDTLKRVAAKATDAAPYLSELTAKARSMTHHGEQRWFRAVLFCEPDNPYDPNAICVHASGYGLVGYLDRDTALDYACVFEELGRQGAKIGACPAIVTGGGPAKSYGVVLALSDPEAVLADLRA